MVGEPPLEVFRLRPTRAAKVSEISEATASSSIPVEERVNFHIGNPVQEPRLSSAYLRVVLGLDVRQETLRDDDPDALCAALEVSESDRRHLEFLRTVIRASVPYLPRGGFTRAAPSPLALSVTAWLEQQQETLAYDLGKTGGRREIILCAGGVTETLRVYFHALSTYLVHAPASIVTWQVAVPPHIREFAGLRFHELPQADDAALAALEQWASEANRPTFVVLGMIPSEQMRRGLRKAALASPLFFLEVNNAPNHWSLAREAKLVDRVIRFLTPGIFSPDLSDLSTVIALGNAEHLALLETVHFQLKGTPSASETGILTYLLEREEPAGRQEEPLPDTGAPVEPPGFGLSGEAAILRATAATESRLSGTMGALHQVVNRTGMAIDALAGRIERGVASHARLLPVDRFAGVPAVEMLRDFSAHPDDQLFVRDLEASFLNAFVRHHPPYRRAHCTVVSGSARTALGLLGFHCGIREVVIPDLSWTYEHCFPSVQAVPLSPELGLDADAIVAAVAGRISSDPEWPRYGAVVLNNPHNATGKVFAADEIRRLVEWLVVHQVRVIDDLSYENVAPVPDLPVIPTLRDHAAALVALGRIRSDQAGLVITVQSVSKTDCLAGARLCVVEIHEDPLRESFRTLMKTITPNAGALLLGYLFYRNSLEVTRAFWRLRNTLFAGRMEALSDAVGNLPEERNPYGITIVPPTGSMYPLMVIRDLPAGLSLEWLATSLARQGIGMIPLSTFARSEKGYRSGRNAFRLTLGGADGAEALRKKTRRVLIDLNRLIAEESSSYRRRDFVMTRPHAVEPPPLESWREVADRIRRQVAARRGGRDLYEELRQERVYRDLLERFVPERLEVYGRRLADRATLAAELASDARGDRGRGLMRRLESEFHKDSLERRQTAFRERLFDRTVHPTQMYSIRTEACFDSIINEIIRGETPPVRLIGSAASELVGEYLGLNVAINSSSESDEVLLDLNAHVDAELFAELQGAPGGRSCLSFWGDWDGSNRPSGQGHLLVAGVLLENVRRLSQIMTLLAARGATAGVPADLLAEITRLPAHSHRFRRVLDEITQLTHQLERRYRGILPFQAATGTWRRIGMAVRIAPDPVTSLWHHNDRLERKMRELRQQRSDALEYYFSLNKRIRKELHRLIPVLGGRLNDPELLRELVLYRDLLQRFVLTPRIHQRLITDQDPFAIDTTVFNLNEVNEIGARYGNPGMVLALQVSMSTKAEALISLDRKLRARREHILRDHPGLDLPPVWLVPLFEGPEAVGGIIPYLQKLWEHALESRRMNQDARDRFAEILPEVFVAGSDLSQQIGQPAGASMNREAKLDMMRWLAEHGLADRIRMKVGTGEPMQRQGGYYSAVSGVPAFLSAPSAGVRFAGHLRESTRTSTAYAVTPMMGFFAGGDLRTLQSAVAEQVRHLPVAEFARFLHHIGDAQRRQHQDIVRACEEMVDSRLRGSRRGAQALERLTVGQREKGYGEFLKLATDHFRQILYGRDEDVVGIHIISYFIARSTPSLRDRPTVRPTQGGKDQGNRILERIAETIPLSRYGSLLRAIAHNQSQTAVLGINQLTTGLFRALDAFARLPVIEGDPQTFIADRILPHLPVYEILHSLRLYQDVGLVHLRAVERAIPAGNSAFLAVREDLDAMRLFLPLLQQELLRRHGIDIDDFFDETRFVPALLPTIRPDLAVLLQPDLFNTNPERLFEQAGGILEAGWKRSVTDLLAVPEKIRDFRARAWDLLERPVFERVKSFVELAVALSSIPTRAGTGDILPSRREIRLPSRVAGFFRGARADDEMYQFLAAAVDHLRSASAGLVEVPPVIVRALQQVERIAAIEEQALSHADQDRLRYYLLQIARLTGEGG